MRKEQQQPPWLINFAKIWSERILRIKIKSHQVWASLSKATITRYDLSPRFFCIDATLLCEFESDKIWINEFE